MMRNKIRWALVTAGLLSLAGCGGFSYSSSASKTGFLISASGSDVNTNGQVSLSSLFPDGEPAPVQWSVAKGDNAGTLGEGRIDATGTYTPPNALSQDTVAVEIRAALTRDPERSTSVTLRIHPGFVQPLMPEVATLALRSSLRASAQITEVGAGTVNWLLSTNAAGTGSSNGLGRLAQSGCQHFNQQYTTCTVTYTAPAELPPAKTVYLVASVNGTQTIAASKILLNDHDLNSTPAANQAIQATHALLGSSGGNDNDYDTYKTPSGKTYIADCCGGTLGALVRDSSGRQYILSNNHVFAESDQAKIGDTIDQPGLMDGACTPLSDASSKVHPVGTLRAYVPIDSSRSNVDAALASVRPGAINSTGSILELGHLRNGILEAAPPVAGTGEVLKPDNLGMDVVKSGRTTGLTCSHIGAIDLMVKVNYYKDCAETQPYYAKTFRHQIAIEGANFTDSGDSGALVLDASNARAIGMYFAGGTNGAGETLSLVNPIHDVLAELGSALGRQLEIVGTRTPHSVACINYNPAGRTEARVIPQLWHERVQAAIASSAYKHFVRGLPAGTILGTAAGASLDDSEYPALIIYVDHDHAAMPVPAIIDGLRTQVITTTANALTQGDAPRQPEEPAEIHLPAQALAHAENVVAAHAERLIRDPAILGVGVTQSLDRPTEAAVLILIDLRKIPREMPVTIDGLRVRYMRLQRFHVTRERSDVLPPAASCAISGKSTGQWKPR